MNREWYTEREICELFGINRTTLWRWRQRYSIRAARLTRRHPLMFHIGDVEDADAQSHENDPTRR